MQMYQVANIQKQLDLTIGSPGHAHLLRRFWQSAGGFWGPTGDRFAWTLSAGIAVTILVHLAASYSMNLWNRVVFDALERRDARIVLMCALAYIPLLILSVSVATAQVYARMTIQRRWRAWFSNYLIDHWMAGGHYYQLNIVAGDHANPEYRLADDLRIATEAPIDFVTGVLSALLSAAMFVIVLWMVGGSISVDVFGFTVNVPGFLVIAAILYAVAASAIMVFIGRGFVAVAEKKNQAEAEYRYRLTHVRENGESIAVLGGERVERIAIGRSLVNVVRGWRDFCSQTLRTTVVAQTSGYVAWIVPIVLCAPKYLEGSMTLGQVMQAASAFTTVQFAFNWLVDNYPRLSEWMASARRTSSLLTSIDALERAEKAGGRIARIPSDVTALRLDHVDVALEDGTIVVKDAELPIGQGERVLVTGDSGTGKSMLVRAIAGLWPWGRGQVRVSSGAKILLLPQRAYVPSGTLLRAVTYPMLWTAKSRAEVEQAMRKVGLDYLIDRLAEDAPWEQRLSGGEKQRLAFARILLHRPDIVVLDEATSALEPESQAELMEALTTELHNATIISVAHRPELERFHDRRIRLARRSGTAQIVADEPLTKH